MATTVKKTKKNPFEPEPDGYELLFIDPKKDVYKSQIVIGPAPADFYSKKILQDLLEQALKKIKPELVEQAGYELMKYEIIIKQRKSKPKA